MSAATELQNYLDHYGHEGLICILAYLEEQGYIVAEPEED